MAEIKLSRGRVVLVDDEDFEWLNQYKWSAYKNRKSGKLYAARKVNGITIYMHREILGLKPGDPNESDHKFGNTLDNRKRVGNLRVANRSQQIINQPVRKDNKLGIKGISKISSGSQAGLFRAQLSINGKRVLNQVYYSLWKAVESRKEAELKYHGEFVNVLQKSP